MNKSSRGHSSAAIVGAARELRRRPTPGEARLWEYLRGGRLDGLKFRRQHPYEGFVLDFFCVESRLCVEVDGGVHLDRVQAGLDAERQAALEAKSIQCLRLGNAEIESNVDQALTRIRDTASRAVLSPGASRQ